jgi:nucleotidyltransferase substrate binding protein (TIGR01987 family)
MALTKIDRKKEDLKKAVASLGVALGFAPPPLVDETEESDPMVDLIRNGILQKFEYTVELLWKTLHNIFKEDGLDLQTPKAVLRHRFTQVDLSDEEKENILMMVDHRNQIAHEYKDFIMKEIYPRISYYHQLMLKILP